MGIKVELKIKDEHAIHIAKSLLGWGYMSEINMPHHVQDLFNNGMYEQSNVHGIDWYRTFEYLKSQGYDLTIYNKKL